MKKTIAVILLLLLGAAAYAHIGLDTGLSTGGGSVTVGGPVTPSGHFLLIDNGGHYLLIDGSSHKLRIDGAS